MMRFVRVAATFGLVAAMATVASAQNQGQRGQGQRGPGGPGGGFGQPSAVLLVNAPVVAEELQITEDQKGDIQAIATELREARQGLRDASPEDRAAKIEESNKAARAKLAKVLKREQMHRLEQIETQAKGLAAFADEHVKKALELTEEQTQKIEALTAETREKARAAFQDAQGDFQAAGEKFRAIQKEAKEKVHALLTDAQKAKWSDLTGKPVELPAMGGRGPGQGQGNRQRNNNN